MLKPKLHLRQTVRFWPHQHQQCVGIIHWILFDWWAWRDDYGTVWILWLLLFHLFIVHSTGGTTTQKNLWFLLAPAAEYLWWLLNIERVNWAWWKKISMSADLPINWVSNCTMNISANSPVLISASLLFCWFHSVPPSYLFPISSPLLLTHFQTHCYPYSLWCHPWTHHWLFTLTDQDTEMLVKRAVSGKHWLKRG